MVDSGMGPIAGVPETDFMVDPNAPSVRPAALDGGAVSADLALGGGGGPAGFSPIDAAPRESASSQSTFMPAPSGAYGGQGYAPTAPGSLDLEPARAFSTPNPLPTVDESDLIMTGGSGMGGYSAPAAPAPVVSQPSYPASGYSAPTSDLTLGPIPDAALSDLVGPVRRPDAGYAMPAAPSGDFYSQPTYAQPPAYPEPSYAGSPYPDPGYQGPTYSSAPSYPDPTYAAPPPPVYPEPSLSSGQTYSQGAVYGNEAPGMGGGWTLGDDFR